MSGYTLDAPQVTPYGVLTIVRDANGVEVGWNLAPLEGDA